MLREFASSSPTDGIELGLEILSDYWSSIRIFLSLGSWQFSTLNPLSGGMSSAGGAVALVECHFLVSKANHEPRIYLGGMYQGSRKKLEF